MPTKSHWMWKKLSDFLTSKEKISPIQIKLSRKRLYLSQSVKYRGIKIDEKLNWKQHIHDIAIKLNRANALFTIRNFVNGLILRTIHFAIFDTHLNYANLIWGQDLNTVSRIVILQKKASRIMNFQYRNSHSSPLFKSNHIHKLEDKILIENILLNNLLPPVFKNWFTFCSHVHNYQPLIYQSHLPLIKYLNDHTEQILSGKNLYHYRSY